MINFRKITKKDLKKFFRKDFKLLLPQLYLIGLLVSIVLILLYATFPSLYVCSSLFGFEFCTPTGVFLALILSIPGYLIAGNLLVRFTDIPWIVSLILVIIVSFIIYRLVGLFIDKYKKAKSQEKVKLIIIGVFTMLVAALLLLLPNSG